VLLVTDSTSGGEFGSESEASTLIVTAMSSGVETATGLASGGDTTVTVTVLVAVNPALFAMV
jgi:hypothetical protein